MPAFAQQAGGMFTDAQVDIIVSGIRSRWAKRYGERRLLGASYRPILRESYPGLSSFLLWRPPGVSAVENRRTSIAEGLHRLSAAGIPDPGAWQTLRESAHVSLAYAADSARTCADDL